MGGGGRRGGLGTDGGIYGGGGGGDDEPVAACVKGSYAQFAACGMLFIMWSGGRSIITECLFFARLTATYSWPWVKQSER